MSEGSSNGELNVLRENKLRAIYDAALKTPGSRELSVEEAEKLIRPYESASDTLKSEIEVEIGAEIYDGTIYAGISPDTGKAMYATPADAPGTYTFNEAARYAENLEAHVHRDWHAPSKGELNVLWENRNKGKLKGTFNESGSNSAGWYWSSSQSNDGYAWGQRFSDGSQDYYGKNFDSSLRCVR
jgi:hypothetical protein